MPARFGKDPTSYLLFRPGSTASRRPTPPRCTSGWGPNLAKSIWRDTGFKGSGPEAFTDHLMKYRVDYDAKFQGYTGVPVGEVKRALGLAEHFDGFVRDAQAGDLKDPPCTPRGWRTRCSAARHELPVRGRPARSAGQHPDRLRHLLSPRSLPVHQVREGSAAGARQLAAELIPSVTTAEPWRPLANKPAQTLNIAFTHRGLKRLGLPKSVRNTFPDDFREGMLKRRTLLGDTGASDPERWEPALRKPHAVVIVTAQTDVVGARAVELGEQLGLAGNRHARAASAPARRTAGALRLRRRVLPAGDPGQCGTRYARWHGHSDRDGVGRGRAGRVRAGVSGEDDRLPYAPNGPLGHAGSYLVLRKLSEDVPAFRAYVEAAAGANGSSPQEIAAKMVGRWQDGRSLVTSGIPNVPDDDPALDPAVINRFRYSSFRGNDIDPHGVRCPIGATCAAPTRAIRWGLKSAGQAPPHHPVGDAYGKLLPDEGQRKADRGLIFVAYQSSIERQFEFIQSRWLNDGDGFWLGDERDFLSPGAGMTVPTPQGPRFLPEREQPFVADSRRRLLLRARPPRSARAGGRLLALKHGRLRYRPHPVGGGDLVHGVAEVEDFVVGRLDSGGQVQRIEAEGLVSEWRGPPRVWSAPALPP